MHDFNPILNALIKEGFHQLPDTKPGTGKPYDFKITPYSLNTKLSFKFENLNHFAAFLQLSEKLTDERLSVLQNTFVELGMDPNDFFYVNFFEKGKDKEM
jgi:hypothetical protein